MFALRSLGIWQLGFVRPKTGDAEECLKAGMVKMTTGVVPYKVTTGCDAPTSTSTHVDGWTFANQKKGSSMPVRFVHRKSGLRDNQFATYDVLPCNHDWKHDLDYFVACEDCRPALMKSKDYANLKHIDPKLPEEPKKCRKCKRMGTSDWHTVWLLTETSRGNGAT